MSRSKHNDPVPELVCPSGQSQPTRCFFEEFDSGNNLSLSLDHRRLALFLISRLSDHAEYFEVGVGRPGSLQWTLMQTASTLLCTCRLARSIVCANSSRFVGDFRDRSLELRGSRSICI